MDRLGTTGESEGVVDPEGVRWFLRNNLAEFAGSFEVSRLGEGQSCLTFLLRGEGWHLVLRRPPRGNLPPTAFDVTREYRVMGALSVARASVPVPRPLALCKDPSVIGAPFYLMEWIEGHVARTRQPEELSSREDRARMGDQLVDTLLALHALDYRVLGLDGFGKEVGYLERQLVRMGQLWDLAKFRNIPEIEQVGTWLARRVPRQSTTTIIHGDYKIDNVIFAPESPARLVAVIDWEMCTLGDPLADLGWLLYFWRDPGDPSFGFRVASVTEMEGYPRRAEVLARYASASNIPVEDIRWHVALAGWKIAIIMEGSYRRFLAGIADHPAFAELEDGVPALARRALQAITGELKV
jgi:aminoglycoside phosphotransferase (APT) family kinase protein